MKINLLKSRILFLILLLASLGFVRPVLAAVSLSVPNASIENNTTATLTLSLNVESNSALGADAILTYPTSDVEITNVGSGNFFTDFGYSNDQANGRLEIHGYFSSLFTGKSGSGTLATISIKGKKSSGTGTMNWVCSGNTATKIVTTSGQNILTCSVLTPVTLTYTGTVAATPTPLPTSTPVPTATSAPIHQDIQPVCTTLSLDRSSGNPTLWVKLTCTGTDADNDINAAEFNFGDGKTELVEKNIGVAGSISVTHPYQRVGSYAATCRLRDNNSVFSGIPTSCVRTLSVLSALRYTPTPKPSPTPTTQSGFGSNSPQSVELTQYATPTPTPQAKEIAKSLNTTQALIGLLIIASSIGVGLFLIFKPSSSYPFPPTTPPYTPPIQ